VADGLVIKLVLLIPTLDRSGAEKQFSLLATGLPREEFDIHVVCLTRGGAYESLLQDHGIPVTVLHKRLKFDPVAFFRLRSFIKRFNPDVLHTWLFAANAYGRLAKGNRERPKVIVSERCVDSWKQSWQLKLDRKLVPRTHRMVANSESVAEFYRGQGFPSERLVVIPNAVAVSDGAISQAGKDALLKEWDIPEGSKVVGYVGRLAPQKRGHDLIWSMQLLRQLMHGVYFVLVGDGPDRVELVKLAQHMGCDHLVRFLGHREDASRLMRAFDTVWLASDFEGQSNSLMEAMAHGIPVVASDIPANRELVVDGETGFLVNVGDCPAMAQFTDRILADPDLARRLGNAGRERMRTKFPVEAMIESHRRLYHEAAG
jgi:glycosyltransferase involved in cell wall biosynthesis